MVKKRNKKGLFYTVHVIEKSLIHHVVEWVATTLSALGAILNANIFNIQLFNTFFVSFYVYFIADLLWIAFAWKHRHWGVFVTFTVFGIINFLAILKNLGILTLY